MGEQLIIPGLVVTDGEADDDRPGWDEYFLGIADAVKARSNDPKCKVGAVIVDSDNVMIAAGYNGLARGVAHHTRRFVKEPGWPEKLRWMCHAELNAIINAARKGVAVKGAKIYTTKFPCLACANAIVQAGIVAVHTGDKKTYDDDLVGDDGQRVFQVLVEAGVRLDAPRLETDVAVGAQRASRAKPRQRARSRRKLAKVEPAFPKVAKSSTRSDGCRRTRLAT